MALDLTCTDTLAQQSSKLNNQMRFVIVIVISYIADLWGNGQTSLLGSNMSTHQLGAYVFEDAWCIIKLWDLPVLKRGGRGW